VVGMDALFRFALAAKRRAKLEGVGWSVLLVMCPSASCSFRRPSRALRSPRHIELGSTEDIADITQHAQIDCGFENTLPGSYTALIACNLSSTASP